MHTHTTYPTETPWQDRFGCSPWHMTWPLAMVAVLGLALLSPSTVQARTFQCRAGDVACLIASIRQANAQPGPRHEIRLEAGTYALMAVDNVTDGPNGLPSITSHLAIQGAGAEATVIARQDSALDFRLVHVAAAGALTLEGLTVRGGQTFGFRGGGLFNRGAIVFAKSTLADNDARTDVIIQGGGLFNEGGTVAIVHSTITGNVAAAGGNADGGGLASRNGTVSIINSSIVGNSAHSGGAGRGGGLFSNGDTVTILNSTIAHNTAPGPGGGLTFVGSTATVINSTIADYSACGTGGSARGGDGLFLGGPITILNSTIVGTTTCEGGDGIHISPSGIAQ